MKEIGPITIASEKSLYCASRNGWRSFHSYCDNKGPTVTVVKSGNYIFGGYTDVDWDGKLLAYQEIMILTIFPFPEMIIPKLNRK